MARVIRASASDVRARIAAAMLGPPPSLTRIGDVTLHAHQADGVARIRRALDRHGGVLLADDVGLGKTFVALALASTAQSPLVVAPASLRTTWFAAAQRAAVGIRFVSLEQLSRRPTVPSTHDLVIIDEAQHVRNTRTQRFAGAATLCRGARVLLLSATPVQNRLDDLRAIVSLFLGTRANALSASELAAFVIRRAEIDVRHLALGLPTVRAPQWLDVAQDSDCLDRLLQLPPPLPAADQGDGGVLLTYTLARQWASSRAALRGALACRLARARAMEDALSAGRMPTTKELAAWTLSDSVQQLSFPELVVTSNIPPAEALLDQVLAHSSALRDLIAWLDGTPDPDSARARALESLLIRHDGERIVAFSEYRDTIAALYRALAPRGRVAMLTHAGARVAGGRMSRADLLARFASGSGATTPTAERIDLLLTTDVLSEGVNLQDASVIVHLDLAWNPARLEQRVGRLRRIGAARDRIHVYVMAPPASAERLLRLEQRLRVKVDEAARAVGVAGAILPGVSSARSGAAEREERIDRLMRVWLRHGSVPDGLLVAAVRADRNAVLVCASDMGAYHLFAIAEGSVSRDRDVIECLLATAHGAETDVPLAECETVQQQVLQWLRARTVADVVDLPSLRAGRARREVLRRVDAIAQRTARHLRPRLSGLMHAARAVARGTLSAGAERVLADLAEAPLADEEWLHALREFAALHARSDVSDEPHVAAILMLVAEDA